MLPTGRGDSDPDRLGSHHGGSSRNEGRDLSGGSTQDLFFSHLPNVYHDVGLIRPRCLPDDVASRCRDLRPRPATLDDGHTPTRTRVPAVGHRTGTYWTAGGS